MMDSDDAIGLGMIAVFVIALLGAFAIFSGVEVTYRDGYDDGYQDGFGNGTKQMSAIMGFGCVSVMRMLDCDDGLQELQEDMWFQDSFNQLIEVFENGND